MNETQNKRTDVVNLWDRFSTSSLVRFLLLFASGWALVQLLQYFEYVIFTFTFAAILALLLNYPVRYLERFLGRSAALGVVIVLSLLSLVVIAVSAGIALASQLQQLITTVITALGSSQNPLTRLENLLLARDIPLDLEPLEQQIQNLLASALSFAVNSIPALLSNYVTFIIILVVAFFMLIDGARLWGWLLKTVPHAHRRRVAQAIQTNFLGFIRGQIIISILLTCASFLVFEIFQIPFALVLAVIVGLFDLIPGIGATLGVSIACLIILVQSGWLTALKVLVVSILLQQVQDNLISPRVMQSTVHLHPVVIFFALLVGTQIAGLLGVLLAVPIAGVIVSLLEIKEMQAK
ncbi:AI-2E family transporter [Leptolyngbya sp. GB1-A1]|jgi:predicted PurR-regulated permease PerM|uniref:AI-2E family transporter n=2 Tax=Leptolyngbya TaxID=47251 RepID=UPI00199DD615|nr:AI-2E family transporter [Cyanobacteria bacterium FACHB-502]